MLIFRFKLVCVLIIIFKFVFMLIFISKLVYMLIFRFKLVFILIFISKCVCMLIFIFKLVCTFMFLVLFTLTFQPKAQIDLYCRTSFKCQVRSLLQSDRAETLYIEHRVGRLAYFKSWLAGVLHPLIQHCV